MEIKELGHLVLYVRNLERSTAFYRDVLGWRMVSPDGEALPFPAAAFASPSGRTHHELLLIEVGEDAAAMPAGRRVGLYHFGLKVGDSDDELREALARLTERGDDGHWCERPHGDAQPLHPGPRRQRDRALRGRARCGLAQPPGAAHEPHRPLRL